MAVAAPRRTHIEIEPPITVRSLSEAIGVKAQDLLRKLMGMNQMVTINASLDDELAVVLAMEFGSELVVVHPRTAEDEMLDAFSTTANAENLQLRPPVITILGHVDHGKTSLLDRIRKSNVVQSESGGITQHIGAYQVESNGRAITFVDTPGHEAFTAMRARGANVTDIVVLVVAADDGVMPQTIEAIAHAKAAGVPIVVALNKIDLPNVDMPANINKIYGELSQQGLHPAEWGGETEVVKTSATSGLGIPELLTTLETIAELHELKADPTRTATGTCLEASLSEGRGVLATFLVREGTLRVGDVIVCGDGFGRVRAIFNDSGRPDRRGRAFHPRGSLGAGRCTHRRRELRRRRGHSACSRGRPGTPHPSSRRGARRPPGGHARKPLLQDGRAEAQEPELDLESGRPGIDRSPHQRARKARRTKKYRSASCSNQSVGSPRATSSWPTPRRPS